MNLDTQLGTYDLHRVSEVARQYERMGFDGVWSFETQHDPFVALAFAAVGSGRLRVGTNIAVAFARSPLATAMAAWDLQRASGGRFTLGLGTQVRVHVERRFSMPWGEPAARVKEAIQCIRAIWDTWQNGTKPGFQGRFYQFRLMTPFFDPGPIEHPAIPIFLAGVNPAMLRTAGEVADGVHVHPMHTVRYLREVVRPSIDEGARNSGRRVDDLELYAPAFAVTGDTPQERERNERDIRQQVAFYASTPNYRGMLDLHGWAGVGERLSQMARHGEWERMGAAISDEMLDAFALTVPQSELAPALRRRYEGLLDRVALYYPPPEEADEAWWRDFVTAFREARP